LTIQRSSDGWRVEAVEIGSSTTHWPSL
jgi:hypothetical protein